MTRPWNIAHRGGAGLNPENTLAAFADAVARGCDGAELDVQLSADGEVVVFHDYRLKPELCRGPSGAWLTKPTPAIKALTLAELQRYDIGRADPASDYARAHGDVVAHDGEHIPTLDEVIDVAKSARQPFRLFVELKTSFAHRDESAAPEELAEATLAVLRRHDFVANTVLVGFDWPGLLHAKTSAPEIECWFTTLPQSWFGDGRPPPQDDPPDALSLSVLRHWASTGTSPWAGGFDAAKHDGSIIKAIAAAGGEGWFPFWRDVTAENAAEAHALGLKVGAWTANAADEMRALQHYGVDALCTDRPDILAAL
ncbi:MAG: glycerophosphodiester phosphodiesterase [Alphaproteobacteria bacterium]|nr:glycerophosphodiester phosphodiesterase [Alphaproteobacteria bacterium]MBU6472040.1 glycerophosphodiester phosphodiesterase [Alphaproteobacteria bacterium]MDE2011581.1 glycerophosphodiester phosphodiesterase [Alphaproteobacteria bacterium]